MIPKRTGKASLLLGLILITTPMIPILPTVLGDLSDPGSLSTHATVAINGNPDFTTSTAVVAGDGSQANPYIIENWTIDAQTADGISIQNTDANFIVRNCWISNGSNAATNEGIYLFNVTNGTVQDSRSDINQYGIYILSSDNITILNNSLNLSAVDGLYVSQSADITIDGNAIFENGASGVVLDSTTTRVDVLNNIINDSVDHGLVLRGTSNDNNASFNDIHNNSRNGIYIYNSATNNRVFNNTVHNNTRHGIYLTGSGSNSIFNNTITNNSRTVSIATFGLYLENTGSNVISGNVMFDNKYNLGIIGQDKDDYNNTIAKNNTVEGKPVYYWLDNTSRTVPEDAGFVGLIDCIDITVANMVMSNNQHGVLMYKTQNSTLDNLTVDTTVYGAYVHNSNNDTLSNSTLTNMSYVAYLRGVSDNLLLNEDIMNDIDYGLFREYNPIDGWIYFTTFTNNTIFNINVDAVNVREGNYYTFRNNTIRDSSGNGIYMRDSDTLTLKDNEIFAVALDAVVLDGRSIDTLIEDNEIHNNIGDGISLLSTNETFIFKNYIHNNTGHGINISTGNLNDIIENRLAFNDRALFLNDDCNNSNFRKNLIYDNTYGIYMTGSFNNRIYDNFFNNTNNYFVSGGSGNEWNTTKDPTVNIVTGPYIGGNYWSDYTGTDTDNDWLGDTLLPFGPGDDHPLLIPPDIFKPMVQDVTSGSPTTGDTFVFNTNVSDNVEVVNVTVEFWFDGGVHTNSSMTLLTGDVTNGTYGLTGNIPAGALQLIYFMSANDTMDNWNWTTNKALAVIDNDAPSLNDDTAGIPTTGDIFAVNVTVNDNINVSLVQVEYWFDVTNTTNASMDPAGGFYLKNITVPLNATSFHYNLSASDNSSNWVVRTQVDLLVLDDEGPSIEDLSGTPTTGDDFTIRSSVTDNMDLDSVMVEHWFDDGPRTNTTMDNDGDFIKNITVPDNAILLHFIVFANDTTGNIYVLPQVDLPVVDNDRPTLQDLTGSPLTGAPFLMKCDAFDNMAIARVEAEYWVDGGSHIIGEMVLNGSYGLVITIPEDARTLSYILRARDGTGNQQQLSDSRSVSDSIKPVIVDLTQGPTTGDPLPISLQVSDNWDDSITYYEYWFDIGVHTNVSYDPVLTVDVPSYALKLRFIISANDTSGNYNVITGELDVLDNDEPTIEDRTTGPTTGDDLTFDLSTDDNIKVQEMYFEYWFDRGQRTNDTYYAPFIVVVPDLALEVNYRFVSIDTSGNEAQYVTSQKVIDNDAPSLTDMSGIPETGEKFKFLTDALDNTMVSEMRLEFSFDDGGLKMYPMSQVGSTYEYTISVPLNATVLEYTITVYDIQANFDSVQASVQVSDIIFPTIIDNTQTGSTGEVLVLDLEISDNIGVTSSKVEYWFDDDPAHSIRQYSPDQEIEVPINANEFHYLVRVEDNAGNMVNISVHTWILDNDPPEIIDKTKGAPSTNGKFKVVASATDNIHVQRVTLEYWSTGTDHKTVEMEEKDGKYVGFVELGNVEDLFYTIRCSDTTGNTVYIKERSLSVSGYIPSSMIYGVIAGIIALIFILLAFVALRRSKDKERERILAIKERRAKEVKRRAAIQKAREEADKEEEFPDEDIVYEGEDDEIIEEPDRTPHRKKGLWEKRVPEEDVDAIDEILLLDEVECPSCGETVEGDYTLCPHCAQDLEG